MNDIARVKSLKPLNGKAYGSIPHLPGSNYGNSDDKGVSAKESVYYLESPGKHDTIIVLEKVDGSCVSVANIAGDIVPLTKIGYRALDSPHEQHRLFARWVYHNINRFSFLTDGMRVCGEWLAQAHGTKYDLEGLSPFCAFDLFIDNIRQPYSLLQFCCKQHGIETAPLLYINIGKGCSINDALSRLGYYGLYGALEEAEGCVWRWERANPEYPIMMAKYVRPSKEIGKYLEGKTKQPPVWNTNWNKQQDIYTK